VTNSAADVRKRLISFFQRDLVGPAHGDDEILEERPSLRYSAGILFPQSSVRDESSEAGGIAADPEATSLEVEPENEPLLDEDEAEPPSNDVIDDEHDDTITLANTFKPSALGLSFCCSSNTTIVVAASAATYSPLTIEGRTRWQRTLLEPQPVTIDLRGSAGWRRHDHVLAEGLKLRAIVRTRPDGTHLCTVSLFNDAVGREFFQVEMRVRAADATAVFAEYRRLALEGYDDEERSLAMLYRNRGVFAAGHGCAADWDEAVGRHVTEVRTCTVPAVRVPPVVPTDTSARWANMQFLSGDGPTDEEIIETLGSLPREYEQWISAREREVPSVGTEFVDRAEEHVRLCRAARQRIEAGIRLLRTDDHSMRAFKLMNAAMLRQQRHTRLRRRLDDPWTLPLTYESDPGSGGYWRVFQIAFVLMNLSGLVPGAEPAERGVVDLIWFSTGGGKTEAYLGLSAFVLFRRRLANRADAGCTILMRYTLRLLTSQQFQRASSLICACELLRRSMPAVLGTDPFTIGLWVGQSLTPNTDAEAVRKLNRLVKDDDAKNPFQLLACPWCGTDLNDRRALGYVHEKHQVFFRCPASAAIHGADACPFSVSGSALPVCVVDESIYSRPPSLLIGTVDKFAMLAWRPEARPLFGGGKVSPPDLIIQDELHLISGPLGSMVGLYEGAIDYLCRDAAHPHGPKIIASTATIRRAGEQCRALFDRPTAQFPPQGLDASDSFFAKEQADADGRIYVGFLPTAASSPLTAQIRAVAALSQGLLLVADGAAPDEIDPYWTLVQYFSSLKELGRAATLVAADIPEYLPSMQRRYGVGKDSRRRMAWTEEMTSRKNEAEIPKILRELERRFSGRSAGTHDLPPLDTLLATNMISVGVDVDRLGLMMVVTQPKGTSEYIQASSRVGRSRRAPGLVVTLYNAGRPRDRSHYEQFRPYHDAFYRFVEPTSVTPYAVPALERALHAVLVILARHVAGLEEPADFDPETAIFATAIEFLRKRVASIDGDQKKVFDAWVSRRVREWRDLQPDDWGGFGPPERNFLMHPMGSPAPSGDFAHYTRYWPTPTSMRNVDAECDGVVVSYPAGGEDHGT
jgi:hypothetical protein